MGSQSDGYLEMILLHKLFQIETKTVVTAYCHELCLCLKQNQ